MVDGQLTQKKRPLENKVGKHIRQALQKGDITDALEILWFIANLHRQQNINCAAFRPYHHFYKKAVFDVRG
jgi:hypothetical protein